VERTLASLRMLAIGCQRCPLAQTREKVVFGVGPGDAALMVVGEGPGVDEDRSGTPFVGDAGHLLDGLLGEVRVSRTEVYITNATLCRPAPGHGPTTGEADTCAPYLHLTLAIVRPQVVVTLGGTATRQLVGPGLLQSLHGRSHARDDASVVVPTWHPSSWNRAPGRRAQAVADLRLALSLLRAPAQEP
jgi:DNA polymerase